MRTSAEVPADDGLMDYLLWVFGVGQSCGIPKIALTLRIADITA
ncbi:hypothetical protein [Nocardia sp. NPDC058497]